MTSHLYLSNVELPFTQYSLNQKDYSLPPFYYKKFQFTKCRYLFIPAIKKLTHFRDYLKQLNYFPIIVITLIKTIRFELITRLFANKTCTEAPEVFPKITKQRLHSMTCHYRIRISNYNIALDAATNSSYVQYCVLIEHKISKNIRTFRFRYRELRNLHDQVVKELEKYKLCINLPEFPSRRMMGRTNTSDESIQQRKNDIELYFNELISHTQVQSLPMISQMLPSAVDPLSKAINPHQPKSSFAQKDDLYFMVENDCNENNNKEEFNSLNTKQHLSVKIKSFERTTETIFYNIHFYHQTSHLKWKIQCRYSELKNLNLGVKACSQDKSIIFPEFPKRHIFSCTNDNLDEIFKRQVKLEKYLNDLLEIENIYPQNEAMKNFIDSSKRQAFAEQLCMQYSQEIVPSHYVNKEFKANIEQNNNENNIPNKKLSRFKFSQRVDIHTFYFYNQPDEILTKQQKRILKRKAKKNLQTLPLQLIFEDEE